MFCLAGCAGYKATTCDTSDRNFSYDELPPFSALVHDNEKLVSIEISDECAGIWGIQNVPDGWSYSSISEGEDYIITITPPGRMELNLASLKPIQIAVLLRGVWSDCFRIVITSNVIVGGGGSMKRVFNAKNIFPPPWIEVLANSKQSNTDFGVTNRP